MNRRKTYNEEISERLRKNKEHAHHFLLGLIEADEDTTVEEAIKTTISYMGVKEFSEWAGVSATNVTSFISGKRKAGPEVLNQYLKPFGLKLKYTVAKAS